MRGRVRLDTYIDRSVKMRLDIIKAKLGARSYNDTLDAILRIVEEVCRNRCDPDLAIKKIRECMSEQDVAIVRY